MPGSSRPSGRGASPDKKTPLFAAFFVLPSVFSLNATRVQTVHRTVLLSPLRAADSCSRFIKKRHSNQPSRSSLNQTVEAQNHIRVFRLLWQVSHCGKPQRTVSAIKPMGFLLSLNLPVGFAPLDPPARISSSAHLSTLADKKQRQTFTGCLAAFFIAALWALPLHPAKEALPLWISRKRNTFVWRFIS